MNMSRQPAFAQGRYLQFMNNIVAGNLPDIPVLLACWLVPHKKKGTIDKVRPIAVGEVATSCSCVCNGSVSHQRLISAPPPVRRMGGRRCIMCGTCRLTSAS